MIKPLLVRLAERMSDERVVVPLAYDEVRQVSVVENDDNLEPAVWRDDIPVLGTKKADVEKGEDQKDTWSPRRKSS